ncbi:ArnT family glycosyltransferase [Paraurantiacibacter namhicola]|uniref:Uncharacterized protein n=1 Tax=Paraurantiacibacter namhicola TaxID=645517 RepID=A0A1C7D7R5_9SPHN|nr:glycosyltransferase family 39 protein [Paraurantiacibacter namhicola]ANU07526.1 hypothetical protein A6F65_01219 [Paraurantiacibacter namhicola]
MTTITADRKALASGSAWPRRGLAVVVLLAVVAVVVRLPFLGDHNADIDEQLYALIGSQMLEGQLPFADLWDRKPLGLFLIYALAAATGLPAPWSYQLLAMIFIVIGAWLVRRLALLVTEHGTATGAAVIYIVLMAIYGSHSAQTEVFHVPAMLAMALLVFDQSRADALRRAFIAMLIGGIALQVKYTVVPQCAFFGAWVLWGQYRKGRSLPQLLALAAGFALAGLLPTILVGLFYLGVGEWDAFWFANFVSFFDRLPAGDSRFVMEQLLYVSPMAALTLFGLYAALRMRTPDSWAAYRFFWLFLAASYATVYFPSTIYNYYFAALVPGSLLVALPFLDRRGPFKVWPLVLTGVGCFALTYYPGRIEASQDHRAAMEDLTAAITPLVGSQADCLWVFDGPTALYQTTGSCLPTRFIYPDHLNNALERDALGIRQIDEVRRIMAAKPPVVVTADRPFTAQNKETLAYVEAAMERDYMPLRTETIHDRRLTAWIRKDQR